MDDRHDVVDIPFTVDLLESMEDRWSPPVRWRAVRQGREWSIEIRGVEADDPAPGREPTLVELLAEAGRLGIPVSMLPEAIASTAMARDGEADDLDDTACCALDDGHPGPCEWDCSDCAGTGLCIECDGGCDCDDVVRCEWCDGSHSCPHCDEGRRIDDWA